MTGDVITLADPGVQDLETGTPVYLVMQGTDSGTGQTLSYSATGLPSGLKIAAATGKITGTLTSTAGTHNVKVTATDSTGAKGSVKFSMVVIASLRTSFHGVSGPVLWTSAASAWTTAPTHDERQQGPDLHVQRDRGAELGVPARR